MALLFMDSFDHYVTADLTANAKWSVSGVTGSATLAIGSATGRRSSQGLRFTTEPFSGNRTFFVQKGLTPADPTTVLIGCAVQVAAGVVGSSGLGLLVVRDGATTQLSLRLNNDLTLSVLRGTTAAGTVLGTTTATLAAAAFAYVEWSTLIHPSAGTTVVRVNGVSVLNLTAQNTRATGASQWTSVLLGNPDLATNATAGSSALPIDYDDLYVLDGSGAGPWNAFLGDCRVDARLPTAAGATTAWTPSAGANWAAVDDAAPNGDTDYTATSTVGAIDTFVTQDAPVVGATIYGVQHCLNLKKMDAGTCAVAPVVRHAGVNYPGADIAPSTAYAYGLQIVAVNPGTGVAWTEAGFNAAEFGYKRTA